MTNHLYQWLLEKIVSGEYKPSEADNAKVMLIQLFIRCYNADVLPALKQLNNLKQLNKEINNEPEERT